MKNRIERVGEEFQKNLNQLTQARTSALSQATDVQSISRTLMQHEALRIERKLGKDHPRTLRLNAKLETNLRVINTLEEERELFQIKVPDVEETDVLIQGRITGRNRLGIGDLTVRIVDADGVPIPEIEGVSTNAVGHFAFSVSEDVAKALEEGQRARVFINVFTRDNKPVSQGTTPLVLKPGARLIQKVTLNRRNLSPIPTRPRPTPTPEPDTVTVPDVIGSTEAAATGALQSVGLTVGDRQTRAVIDQIGIILEQDPPAGTQAQRDSAVTLVIGVAEQIDVPELVGLSLEEAISAIRQARLSVGSIDDRPDQRHNIVLEQEPKPGVEVDAGTEIELVVGREEQAVDFRSRLLEWFTQDQQFDDLELSERALSNRFEAQDINNRSQLESLLDGSDQDLRDTFRLPNLRSARAFKVILERALVGL